MYLILKKFKAFFNTYVKAEFLIWKKVDKFNYIKF